MAAWTLVMSLDHSPAERRWLDSAVADAAGVPVDWIGRTDLEVQLGQHPDFMRGFAPGNVEKLALQMLAEYNQQQAAPPQTAGVVVQ